jgi:uncharacterized protein (TIGR02391 family)
MKYCPNGHMVWSLDGIVTQPKCSNCGEELIEKCDSCEGPLPNTWTAYYLSTMGKPSVFPKRPDHCPSCGKSLPWASTFTKKLESEGYWGILHPKATQLAKSRFESGHYADAVEAVFKEVNFNLKKLHKERTGNELDGVALMRKCFSPSDPTLLLGDLSTETGRNMQQGYLDIFAGAMAAIRNPKAHGNISIEKERAVHFLMLGSLLLQKIDEGQEP